MTIQPITQATWTNIYQTAYQFFTQHRVQHVFVTGHRPKRMQALNIKYNFGESIETNNVIYALQAIVVAAQHAKIQTLHNGMALGFDQWVAKLCIANHVPVRAFIPCYNHSSKWLNEAKRDYEQQLTQCQEVIYTGTEYTYDCMNVRDAAMMQGTDAGFALLDHNLWNSGTGRAIQNAIKQQKPVLVLDPKDLSIHVYK